VNVRVLETSEEQEEGLQHLKQIPPDTLYVFPVVPEGTEFHSMNVPEPFDIALSDLGTVLSVDAAEGRAEMLTPL